MKYFQVNVKWQSGFEHSYCIAGSEKNRQQELDRLSTFTHVSNFIIHEINEHQYNENKQLN